MYINIDNLSGGFNPFENRVVQIESLPNMGKTYKIFATIT